MERIFATRQVWDASGDVDLDAEIAKVVPPAVMVQLRERLATDTKLDEGIEADRVAGQGDRLDHTPFAVIVHDGKREAITDGPLSFEALKSRIESALLPGRPAVQAGS